MPLFTRGALVYELLFVQVEDTSMGSLCLPQDESTHSGKQREWGPALHTCRGSTCSFLFTYVCALVCDLLCFQHYTYLQFWFTSFLVCKQNSGTN